MRNMSQDLDTLRRWEDAGGTWQFEYRHGDTVGISLRRCDGGEEVERLESSEIDLVRYVESNGDGSDFGPTP